jgi:hypothetical protein
MILLEEWRKETIIITAVINGRHMHNSLHYVGSAIDFTMPKLSIEQSREKVTQGRALLGIDFDLLYDETMGNQHFHLEFQPEHAYTESLRIE